MSYVRALALLSCVFLVGPVLAQGKWTKLAAFPEPAEELLGASAGGKMYVFCGLAPGWKPIGMVYEYDPSGDKWTKKKPMPLASHHVSFTEYKGKIYAFGGFVLPQSGRPPGSDRQRLGVRPRHRQLEGARAAADQARVAVAVTVGDRMVVIGGATTLPGSTAVHPARPHYSVGAVEEYDPPPTPGAHARRFRRRAITPRRAW